MDLQASMQPFSAEPSTSPTLLAGTLRSSCGLKPTSCASREPRLVVFAIGTTGCDPFLALAHRARCARAILRREAADIIRLGWFAFLSCSEPFNDSITAIAWSMLSTRACACLRSSTKLLKRTA